MKIALIAPKIKNDYLTDTVIDGLLSLKEERDIEFRVTEGYPSRLDISNFFLDEVEFLEFSLSADLILFFWGKGNTNFELAHKLNSFHKTVFIDGSEVGGNHRLDSGILHQLEMGTYEGNGKVDKEMLEKCALYFKREKPYLKGVTPFPFGIERKYRKYYSGGVKKEIDFFCVFGQDEYPILRREVKFALEDFCKKNGFTYFTEKTDQDNFYKVLSKSKVGISVGGGGYDTARFWEILGNNCLLMTEKIAVYEPNSERLKYQRIWQFDDLKQFNSQLEKMGDFLKNEYRQENLEEEYREILEDHSTKARVLEIIEKAVEKGIIGKS